MSHKKQSAGQEAMAHTKEIRYQLNTHLDLLEAFGQKYGFTVNVPELFADDKRHRALITWGIDKSLDRAAELTAIYQQELGDRHPRLDVEFIGSVLV